MGLFDFVTKTQEKLQKQSEELAQKLGTVQNQIETESLDSLLKQAYQNRKQNTTPQKPKLDRSIEGISKQILEQRDSMRKNGFKHYVYIADHDACDICKQLNGKVFPILQLKIGVNAPPMHDGCRCGIAAYEDRAEYEKWLNSK